MRKIPLLFSYVNVVRNISKLKHYAYFLLSILFIASCNNSSDKLRNQVVFYFNTTESELTSDYEYHYNSVQEYYSKKDIVISKSENRILKIGDNKIDIPINEPFVMVLIKENGQYELVNDFGTDVELIEDIDKFFEIKK